MSPCDTLFSQSPIFVFAIILFDALKISNEFTGNTDLKRSCTVDQGKPLFLL